MGRSADRRLSATAPGRSASRMIRSSWRRRIKFSPSTPSADRVTRLLSFGRNAADHGDGLLGKEALQVGVFGDYDQAALGCAHDNHMVGQLASVALRPR